MTSAVKIGRNSTVSIFVDDIATSGWQTDHRWSVECLFNKYSVKMYSRYGIGIVVPGTEYGREYRQLQSAFFCASSSVLCRMYSTLYSTIYGSTVEQPSNRSPFMLHRDSFHWRVLYSTVQALQYLVLVPRTSICIMSIRCVLSWYTFYGTVDTVLGALMDIEQLYGTGVLELMYV